MPTFIPPYLNPITERPPRTVSQTNFFSQQLSLIIPSTKHAIFENIIYGRLDLLEKPEIFPKDEGNTTNRILYIEETNEIPNMKITFTFDEAYITLLTVTNWN